MMPRLRHLFHLLYQTYLHWSADRGSTLAASVAYYTALAFFPLSLILLSTFGVFLEVTQTGQEAEEQILDAIGDQLSENLQAQVATALKQLQERASFGGPVGFITLLVVVIALFSQIDLAFNRIWKIPEGNPQGLWGTLRDIIVVRLKAFLMLVGLLCVLFVIFTSGVVLTATSHWLPLPQWVMWSAQLLVSWLLNAGVFAVLYYTIPNTKVPWLAALNGGVFAALIWEIGRQILATIVIGDRYDSAYGVIGAFIAIMLWAYYAATVLFFGAEFVQTISAEDRKRFD
jgi:membrane protein